MNIVLKLLQLGSLIVCLQLPLFAHAQQHPADYWEIGIDLGYLTKIRHNSPLDYAIVPAQLLWRTPAAFDLWRGEGGARLAVRQRLAIVAETYLKGAEDYYFGFSGSPSIELWTADQKTALFYEIGGGAGLINAKKITGAQGQNFTLNWFTQVGVRHQLSKKMAVTGGAYFTHHSNLGMTKPNPGIDVLGLNFGIVWQLE